MSPTPQEALSRLAIPPEKKSRRKIGPVVVLVLVVVAVVAGLVLYAATGKADRKPIPSRAGVGGSGNCE